MLKSDKRVRYSKIVLRFKAVFLRIETKSPWLNFLCLTLGMFHNAALDGPRLDFKCSLSGINQWLKVLKPFRPLKKTHTKRLRALNMKSNVVHPRLTAYSLLMWWITILIIIHYYTIMFRNLHRFTALRCSCLATIAYLPL